VIRLTFALLLAAFSSLAAAQGAAAPDLTALAGGGEQQKFLHPDQAFQVSAALQGDALALRFTVHQGYYLYRDKLNVTLEAGSPRVLGELDLPAGEGHEDEYFGKQRVYRGEATVRAKLGGSGPFTVKVQYQGCADAGLCYPPQFRSFAFDADGALVGGGTPSVASNAPVSRIPAATTAAASTADAPEQDRLAGVIGSGSLGLVIGVFFLAGLALTFTPCVLPMIPILSGIIAGEGGRATPMRAFLVSLTYVLAMALTYTLAGVLAGLFGQNLQAALQDPWVLGSFALMFVALAFSMFGYYELQMPSAVQTWLTQVSNSQRGGTFVGAAVMGVLSALIVGPCVTAPLVGALVYIGQSGDPLRGGIALFALSLGMGVPLLLVGTSLGSLLPRAGGWMDTVKQAFGILLLGVALWFARTLLPAGLVMLGWGLLAIGFAALLGLYDAAPRGVALAKRTLALVVLVWGLAIVVGAAAGGRDPLAPLAALRGSSAGAEQGLAFRRIKSVAELDAALAQAKSEQRPVLLDFYADWCVACKEMESYTFNTAAVRSALAGVVLLQADVTANDEADRALLARFGLFGPPTTILFGAGGEELMAARAVGFVSADEYAARLRKALGK
jgi:thiol:disulfide interchange protein DsbD